MDTKKKIASIALIVIGGAVCLFQLGIKVKNLIFIAGAKETVGMVKNVESWTRHGGSGRNRTVTTNHVMTVEYTVNDVVYTSTFNSGEEVVSEGRPVTVYYKEKNPKKAVTSVEMKKGIHYMYPLMLGLGIFFLIVDWLNGKDLVKK